MRTNRRAATSSTRESATWETISPLRSRKRSRPAVNPRPLAFITVPGSALAAWIAGATPNSTQVNSATPNVKDSTRRSG